MTTKQQFAYAFLTCFGYFHNPIEHIRYHETIILSREESLVHIMAHEFWHLWQRLYKEKPSDRHADMYAIAKQREWSRRMIQNKICNVLEEYGIENPGGYYRDVIIEATKHYRTCTMWPHDREKRSTAQKRRHAAEGWKKAHVWDADKGTWK